ncbi:hypothetical protein [Methylomonas methanica]|uniref:Uncharacterized protein n=1 Tax=Methylomonas methanica (strain DSM 25384 / MC09) TaxID=857087 RepID=G0A6Y8_METMM|nr:hypothetical protein [Methylomonas methanica]AEG01782.1 hypothetical protein Metme_3411 [Methylomonas methanica MC09]
MLKKIKWLLVFLLAVPILLVVLGFFQLWKMSYNHTGEISTALIYGETNKSKDAQLNNQIITTVLNTRFPSGSKLADLHSMIDKLGGKCKVNPKGGIDCRISQSSTFCISSWLDILIDINADETIKDIEARSEWLGC